MFFFSESRVASFLGQGFYTIGPCGEELIGAISIHLRSYDLTALHYRHLALSVTKQLFHSNPARNSYDIALDRARGYVCSIHDPVTGGKHCSIGGGPSEFIVTSTLASQTCPAVGRALAIPLSHVLLPKNQCNFNKHAISFVSIGDGSINNAHFLCGLNLSRYAAKSGIKCPVVFMISDNELCISLRSNGYVDSFVKSLSDEFLVSTADGNDIVSILSASKECIDHSRRRSKPSLLLIKNLKRRFGHAASDLQHLYMSEQEIESQKKSDALSHTFQELLQLNLYTRSEIESLFHTLKDEVETAFNIASLEAKHKSRDDLMLSNAASIHDIRNHQHRIEFRTENHVKHPANDVMRKLMTRFYHEQLSHDQRVVYIGEDVEHGGYYRVTDGLKATFGSKRVRDFPPDETSLLGVAQGFAQAGLIPIVEIPYAKYLDCGMDMFNEIALTYWLGNSSKSSLPANGCVTGMLIRLQGFDKGVFGGNFHTHNMLNFPPGVDVFCFSNGYDYVRGLRFAMKCVKQGRVVMSVDSTDLLNRRHIVPSHQDERWLMPFPSVESDHNEYDIDQIIVYNHSVNGGLLDNGTKHSTLVVVITYGNGVPTALAAKVHLIQYTDVLVIDCPCLSQTPTQLVSFLRELFTQHHGQQVYVLFADVCKYSVGSGGNNAPMAMRALDLHHFSLLNKATAWRVIGATNTYNPLGSVITFLSEEDIIQAVKSMVNL